MKKFKPRLNKHGEEEVSPGHFVYPPVSLKPQVIPKLTKREEQLAYWALSYWLSDYNDAPHDEIERLRKKLLKRGAKP